MGEYKFRVRIQRYSDYSLISVISNIKTNEGFRKYRMAKSACSSPSAKQSFAIQQKWDDKRFRSNAETKCLMQDFFFDLAEVHMTTCDYCLWSAA